MNFKDFHHKYYYEINYGFAEKKWCSELNWIFSINPQKFKSISDITLLFNGGSENGILSYVDNAYLLLNDTEVDSIENDVDDERICTFSKFSSEYPIPSFSLDKIEISVHFADVPFNSDTEMIRILGSVTTDLNFVPNDMKNNKWEYCTDFYSFICNDNKTTVLKQNNLTKNLLGILNDEWT